MCGISGISNFENKPSFNIGKIMNDAINRRGPDDTAYFHNEIIFFGHKRLSIIDLEKSKQPMQSQETGSILIFNGEIYNFRELKKDLINLGYSFETQGDTEVLLKSYDAWGINSLKKLEGMFAFAIWDEKRKKLVLARDKLGEKPLFFSVLKNYGFIFSSEIKSFLASKELKKNFSLNFEAINQYLSLNYLLGQTTFLNEIFSLPPASYLEINKFNYNNLDLIKPKNYWALHSFFKNKTNDTFEQASEKLYNMLKQSTELRMFSDVNNGTFLSGGMDSSAISFNLKEINNHKMTAHNIAFKEEDFNEYSDAEYLSKRLNIDLMSYILPNGENLVNDFPSIVQAMDQPMSDTSFLSTFYLSKFSSKKSKVVLSGDGADELLCGYDTYLASKIKKFLPNNNLVKNVLSSLKIFFKPSISKISLDYKFNKFTNGIPYEDYQSHILWREIFSSSEKKNLCKFQEKFSSNDTILEYINNKQKLVSDLEFFDQCIYLDLTTWLPNDILYKIDRSTMHHSQETRLPFLDSRLIEYLCKLPSSFKFNFFKRKKLLRHCLRNKLPKKTLQKKKSGFNTPIGLWLINDAKFKEMSYSLITSDSMTKIFEKDRIEEIWNSHQSKSFDQSFKIFNLMCFSQWIQNNKLEHLL